MLLGDELPAKLAIARQAASSQLWDKIEAKVRWNDLGAAHDVAMLDARFPPMLKGDLAALANIRAYADLARTRAGTKREILQLGVSIERLEPMVKSGGDYYPDGWLMMLNVRLAQMYSRLGAGHYPLSQQYMDRAYDYAENHLDYAALRMVHGTVLAGVAPKEALAAFHTALDEYKPLLDDEYHRTRTLPLYRFIRLWLAALYRSQGSKVRGFWHAAQGKHVKWGEGWIIDYGDHVLSGPSPYMEPFCPTQ